MPTPLVFEGKFTEKYFEKFHLPKIEFQCSDGWFIWTFYLKTARIQKFVRLLDLDYCTLLHGSNMFTTDLVILEGKEL